MLYALNYCENVVWLLLLVIRLVWSPLDEEGEAKYSFPVSKKIQLKPNNSQNVGYYAPRRPNLSKPQCPSHPQRTESSRVLHPQAESLNGGSHESLLVVLTDRQRYLWKKSYFLKLKVIQPQFKYYLHLEKSPPM